MCATTCQRKLWHDGGTRCRWAEKQDVHSCGKTSSWSLPPACVLGDGTRHPCCCLRIAPEQVARMAWGQQAMAGPRPISQGDVSDLVLLAATTALVFCVWSKQ
jgi:hypothetical protein